MTPPRHAYRVWVFLLFAGPLFHGSLATGQPPPFPLSSHLAPDVRSRMAEGARASTSSAHPTVGEPASHASWREQRARFVGALRDPSLRPYERRLVSEAMRESFYRMLDARAVEQPRTNVAATADDGTWKRIPTPTARAFHTAIYDPVRDRMVVFGGLDWWLDADYGDAHALSLGENPTWTPLPTAPFGGRIGHTAIYDPVRDRMVVFGGRTGRWSGPTNDIWALSLGDTPTWSQITPAGTPPSPRSEHTAIYDPVLDRMVVFGGGTNDIWALSLSGTPTWSQLTPVGTPPSPRSDHTAIYDPLRDRMIVYGGDSNDPYNPLDDVWALSLGDTPTWSQLTPLGTPPSGRRGHTAVYDALRDRMVVFGGSWDWDPGNELWTLSLGGTPTWSEITATNLPPFSVSLYERLEHAAIYDPLRDRMVVFGGHDTFEIYVWDDAVALSLGDPPSWIALQPVGRVPVRGTTSPIVYDPVRDRFVVGSEWGHHVGLGEWWTLFLGEVPLWRELPAQGTPPGAGFGQAAIYDPVRDRMVVFGGSGWGVGNELWTLSLGNTPTWSQLTPAGIPPPARYKHSGIYDPLRDRMVVFGGTTDNVSSLNDVWALSLGSTPTWTGLTPAGTPPSPRHEHTAIYDPVRDRMVVFGGEDAEGISDEVWALSLGDTPTWSEILPEGAPPSAVGSGHAAIYDPVRDRMVVFGGLYNNEAWSLSLGAISTWSGLAPAGSLPQPRFWHRALYDPLRDRMLIVGGEYGISGDSPLNDVWALTWGTPLLPPASVVAVAGPASITLQWTPSPSEDVVGYWISYGPVHEGVRHTGDQAAEGPSGIEVPASQTSLTLTCLPDSLFHLVVQAVGGAGGRSGWSQEAVAQVQRVDGMLAVAPATLSSLSQGRWVSAVLEPGTGFAAEQVVVESLRLNEVLAPERVVLGDENGNGALDLALKFSRAELVELLRQGEWAEVRVTGQVLGCRDTLTCAVRDTIRLFQPRVTHPVAGEQVAAGSILEIACTLPSELAVDSVAVLVSVDNQRSWELVGSGLVGRSVWEWGAPGWAAESCYVAVVAYQGGEEMGVGYGGPFQVVSPVAVMPLTERFGLQGARPHPFRAGGVIAFGVAQAGVVSLRVYDLRGRLVETLVEGPVPAGRREVAWDAHGVAGGVYFLQLRSGALQDNRRVVVAR